MTTTPPEGLIPRIAAALAGPRAARLTERLQRLHWLSYLLILAQSAAVLIVFGHADVPLLTTTAWTIRSLAAGALFVLVATVIAADLAMLETLRRIPALRRNRQHAQLREHLAYVGFVQLIEISTYAVVLAAIESDPRRLISPRPLIPNNGPVFLLQIVLRSALIAWTAIQLVIVRGKLPVLLSTLTATGKEIIGAHVEKRLAQLNIAHISLPAAFQTYAAMSRPPRSVRTWWNGQRIARELAQEAEEERQTTNVIEALERLELPALERSFSLPPTDPTPDPSSRRTPPPDRGATRPGASAAALMRPNVRVLPDRKTQPTRSDAGMTAADRAKLRERRIEACRKYMANHPNPSLRELARAIAIATKRRCNTDTAAQCKAWVLEHPILTLEPPTSPAAAAK